MLNWIWLGLLTVAALLAGFTGRLAAMTEGAIKAAETSVSVVLGLIGIMALWLGLMRLAEKSGMVVSLAKLLRPLLKRLFPDVPADHPAMGSMVMNIAANALGLTNAATPMGLRAMRDLQTLNPRPDTATDAMCTFLAINTGSVQLIPTTAIAILAANGSKNPTVIIGTTLVATTCSSLAGLAVVKAAQRLRWFRLPPAGSVTASVVSEETEAPVAPKPIPVAAAVGLVALCVCFVIFGVRLLTQTPAEGADALTGTAGWVRALNTLSVVALPFLFVMIPAYAAARGVKPYEEFVEGAKEGFNTAVRIIPYLVAMLVAIGCLRGAGGIEWLTSVLRPVLDVIHYPPELVPMTLLRPLTGSGTLAAFTDLVKTSGADSMLARMGGTLFGSTETTFYVVAVYFGAVGIRRTRHALLAGLAADIAGAIAAVVVCRAMLG